MRVSTKLSLVVGALSSLLSLAAIEFKETVSLTEVASGIVRNVRQVTVSPDGSTLRTVERGSLAPVHVSGKKLRPEVLTALAETLEKEGFATLPQELGVAPIINNREVIITVGTKSVRYSLSAKDDARPAVLFPHLKASLNADERRFGTILEHLYNATHE